MKNPDESIDWSQVRAQSARESQRKQVKMLQEGNQMADAPLPLHKSIYINEDRFQAEREHIFLSQPLVACLSGDIANPGDTIYAAEGVYEENITIDKSIRIFGNNVGVAGTDTR
ncbi:MAG: hypothetical protein ACPGN5_04725, partial [Porticoccaceae bacterium]